MSLKGTNLSLYSVSILLVVPWETAGKQSYKNGIRYLKYGYLNFN